MVDKINKEECIARVYQFLNKQKDWKTEADDNGNGTIVKTEFRAYLYSSGFKFNSGENKSDIVDAFWDSIDINKSGKIRAGSKTNNKNALDSEEIKNMEETVKATETIIRFMQDKEAPAEIGSYSAKWKNSVKQGLIYRASEFLKKASIEDITDEWLNQAYQQSSIKATADYMAIIVIDEKLGDIDNYKVGSDKDLEKIVNQYVGQLEGSDKSYEEVISEVKTIINAYVDTAVTNSSESTKLLGNYGYDATEINDLQHAVLINDVKTEVGNRYPDLYRFMSDEVNEKVKAFVDSFVYGGDDFMTMKNNVQNYASQFISSTEFQAIEKDYNEFKTAKDTFISLVESQSSQTDHTTERQSAING